MPQAVSKPLYEFFGGFDTTLRVTQPPETAYVHVKNLLLYPGNCAFLYAGFGGGGSSNGLLHSPPYFSGASSAPVAFGGATVCAAPYCGSRLCELLGNERQRQQTSWK